MNIILQAIWIVASFCWEALQLLRFNSIVKVFFFNSARHFCWHVNWSTACYFNGPPTSQKSPVRPPSAAPASVWRTLYPPCQSTAKFQWDLKALLCQNEHDFQWSWQIHCKCYTVVELLLLHLNTQILLIPGIGSYAMCSLTTGIVIVVFHAR